MQKLIISWVGTLVLVACAGTPPAWWTPGKTAATPQKQTAVSPAPQKPAVLPPPAEEQIILLPQDDYEEMALTPLPNEEDEDESAETSSQTLVPQEDTLPGPSILDEL